jgi:hypothetical protein
VLLDHREQVAEERALLAAELLGDGVGPRSAGAAMRLADASVAAALAVELPGGALAVAL